MQIQGSVDVDAIGFPAHGQSTFHRVAPEPADGGQKRLFGFAHALHEVLVVAVQLYVIDVVEGFRCAFLPEKGFTRAVNHGVNFLVRGTHPHGYLGRDRGFRQIDHHRAGHTRHLCQIVIAGLTASFRIR